MVKLFPLTNNAWRLCRVVLWVAVVLPTLLLTTTRLQGRAVTVRKPCTDKQDAANSKPFAANLMSVCFAGSKSYFPSFGRGELELLLFLYFRGDHRAYTSSKISVARVPFVLFNFCLGREGSRGRGMRRAHMAVPGERDPGRRCKVVLFGAGTLRAWSGVIDHA